MSGERMQDSGVKLRIQVSSFVLRWILVAALTLSPLMAQDPPPAKLRIIMPEGRRAAGNTLQRVDNSLVGTAILSALPSRGAAAAFPNGTQTTSPGRTFSPMFGVLIVAGAAVAAFLALSGKERKQSITPVVPVVPVVPVGPIVTVVTPGTPTINPPSNR